MAEPLSDRLAKEYAAAFDDFDDLTLARWLAQTLGQLKGRAWRYSHPLIGTYRIAADLAHAKQVWLKRLANVPDGFAPADCCRSPSLPLFSRDVLQSGLICLHCSETLVSFDDLPEELKAPTQLWAEEYGRIHAVAHWDDYQRKNAGDYDHACDEAATQAEAMLGQAAGSLIPRFLDHFPAVIWEDQDECLEVLPEDIIPDHLV